MLQSFRDNIRGVTAAIVIGLLIIPFAFFGVESLFVSGSSVEEAANVNGEKISRLEVDRGVEFQKQRILSQFENAPPQLLDDERLRGPVLEQLIQQKLLIVTARENGMAIPDETFNQIILTNENFQENGRFDNKLYQYQLGRLGFTPASYRETVKDELLANQFSAGLHISAFNTPGQIENFARLALQQRSFDYLVLNNKDVAEIKVSPEEISAYYEENRESMTEPDRAIVEYIELTPEILESAIAVEEEQIKARLEENPGSQGEAVTTWRLAHILIPKSKDDKQVKTVELIQQRLAKGEDFAKLATEYSVDFGSAESGGELGTFTRDSLPAGFEDAIAKLATGAVSAPVELESGVHIIKVLDKTDMVSERKAPSREEAVAQLKREMAVEKIPATLERLKEETFSVDSLASAAETLQLPVQVSEPFTVEGGSGIASFPAVAKAAFSDDVLKQGYASEVLELGDNHFVVIKLKEFVASHQPPVEKVSDEIRQVLTIRKAQAAVQQHGESILAAVRSGDDFAGVAAKESVTVSSKSGVTRFDQQVPPELGRAIFQHPSSVKLPLYGMATTLKGDAYVYAVREIKQGSIETLSEEERKGLRLSLSQLSAVREAAAYQNALEADAEIVK